MDIIRRSVAVCVCVWSSHKDIQVIEENTM